MRCREIRDELVALWDSEAPAEVRRHLAECASCSTYFHDLQQVRSGWRVLKGDAPVVPSVGFAQRLVRHLSEISRAPSMGDFFERVGRRFVYAGLVLALFATLAVLLPSMGPVRGLAAADIQMQEATLAYSDPVGMAGPQETSDVAPAERAPAVNNEGK